MLNQMMERTGSRIDANISQCGANNIKSAIITCMACKSADECKLWLKEVEGEVSPPDFCANAQKLKQMRTH